MLVKLVLCKLLERGRGRDRGRGIHWQQRRENRTTHFEGVEVDKVGQEGKLIITKVVIAWKRDLLIDHVECIVCGQSLIRAIKQLLYNVCVLNRTGQVLKVNGHTTLYVE